VKKTRFLFLITLLLVGGVLLTACGGQAPAIGAPGMTLQGDQVFLASGGYLRRRRERWLRADTANDKGRPCRCDTRPKARTSPLDLRPRV
jgi:hypothetical protein